MRTKTYWWWVRSTGNAWNFIVGVIYDIGIVKEAYCKYDGGVSLVCKI